MRSTRRTPRSGCPATPWHLAAVLALGVAGLAGWRWTGADPARTGSGVDLGTLPRGVSRDRLNLVLVTLDTTRADRIGAYGARDVETPAFDRARARGRALRAGGVGRAADAAGALEHVHRQVPARARRARQRRVLPRPRAAHARRSAQGARIPDRRVRRRVRARLEVGHQPGLRHLLRRVRPQRDRRRCLCRSDPAARQRGASTRRCPGSGVSERDRRSSPGFISTTRTRRTGRRSRSPRATRGIPTTARSPLPTRQVGRVARPARVAQASDDRTVVMVMGDHGESLGDHGESAHGFFVYNSMTHVPFVIRAPFSLTQHRRVADPVRSVDVMPTVLDLLGVAAPRGHLRREPRAAHDRGKTRARARRLLRGDVPAAPLRVERPARAAVGPLQGHRRAAARAVRRRSRSAGSTRTSSPSAGARRPDDRAAAHDSRGRSRRRRRRCRPATSIRKRGNGSPRSATSDSFVATASDPRTGRADPKDKIGAVQQARHGHRAVEGPRARTTRPRFRRSSRCSTRSCARIPQVIDAWFMMGTQYLRPRRAAPRRVELLQADAQPEAGLRPRRLQPGAGVPPDGRRRRGAGGVRALSARSIRRTRSCSTRWARSGSIAATLARAEELFRRALEIDPQVAAAKNALGVIALQRGDPASGRAADPRGDRRSSRRFGSRTSISRCWPSSAAICRRPSASMSRS